MAQISFAVRSFVQQRLLDSASGFNYWIQQVLPDYGIIDSIQLTQGQSLILGQYDPRELEESGNISYPLAMVYSIRTEQGRPGTGELVSPNEFSGRVPTGVDFYTGFLSDAPPSDPESMADAIEDAMYETFNRQDYYSLSAQAGVHYNNEMDSTRGLLQWGGSNWRQLIRFVITHRIYTMGR